VHSPFLVMCRGQQVAARLLVFHIDRSFPVFFAASKGFPSPEWQQGKNWFPRTDSLGHT
jgi:hypothetical protein